MGDRDKCGQFRQGHEFHYLLATVGCGLEYSTLGVARICNEIHGPLRYRSHLSPTLLPGKPRTKRSKAVVQTVTANVTVSVWLRETKRVVHWGAHTTKIPTERASSGFDVQLFISQS